MLTIITRDNNVHVYNLVYQQLIPTKIALKAGFKLTFDIHITAAKTPINAFLKLTYLQ